MTEAIWIALIGSVVGPTVVLAIGWWLNNRKKKKPHDMVTEALAVGQTVTSKIEQLKEKHLIQKVLLPLLQSSCLRSADTFRYTFFKTKKTLKMMTNLNQVKLNF